MAWSTRELAELAGTTVNTVRHYHRIGLLEEPGRHWNGYKQYGVRDLVRLLRIRRLAELGVPLSAVGEVGAGCDGAPEALRALDAELTASIERWQRARSAIAAILRDDAPADTPAGFEPVAAHLSESDRAIIHIYAQLYDAEAMADLRTMVEVDAETGALGERLTRLPPDADEATRRELAERLAPALAQNLRDHPWVGCPRGRLSKSAAVTRRTFAEAVTELYNPAQLDVLARAGAIAQEQLATDPATADSCPRAAGATAS
ncbi:MerR family transcriptional regulator [Desertihabitans aurantiacus]|uniref:MerR family transcriptional regulator n=1 Tax=Desertihabitans aurantiacus TaxID=2282477 RepID=UPI000DF8459A|nr:MerR family transcriptional regulator [Desertihabitans aurantiacus]